MPEPCDATTKCLVEGFPADWMALAGLGPVGRFEVIDANLTGRPGRKYGFRQRIQAFVGPARAEGKPTQFADHFVFLAGDGTEDVYRGLTELGLNTEVHYSRAEGKQRLGREFLKGDPVDLFIA